MVSAGPNKQADPESYQTLVLGHARAGSGHTKVLFPIMLVVPTGLPPSILAPILRDALNACEAQPGGQGKGVWTP